jgi:hypothetical protein
MNTDVKGCSTCQKGEEHYEFFKIHRLPCCQYDYRHTDGELFSTVARNLETAREKKSVWLIEKMVKEYKADPNCSPELWIAPEGLNDYEQKLFIKVASSVITGTIKEAVINTLFNKDQKPIKEYSGYQKIIYDILVKLGRTDIDPRHVEGYMRLQYSTLDHLDHATFVSETRIGIDCVDLDGVQSAEDNALSYGL